MISTRRNLLQVVLSLILLVSPGGIGLSQSATPQPVINARVVKVLQIDGLLFKDLNKNNKLDVYEDWRRSIDERAGDLVAQMTVEEKAGLMVGPIVTNPRNHYGARAAFEMIEAGNAFSQWPGTLGLAAMRDTALVEEFARIAAQEYVSVGIRGAYHPT
jgi:beta-glucosidase-like glycosyl hydrolase